MNPAVRVSLATLTLSAVGFVGITTFEAYRPVAYDDGVGRQTIGFGSTEGVRPGDKITVERALSRAIDSTNKVEVAIKRCVRVPLAQREYDAYVSLAYNIGTTAFCGSTLVKKLNAGDYVGACNEILRWDKAGGRILKGLTVRREKEHKLCLGV